MYMCINMYRFRVHYDSYQQYCGPMFLLANLYDLLGVPRGPSPPALPSLRSSRPKEVGLLAQLYVVRKSHGHPSTIS